MPVGIVGAAIVGLVVSLVAACESGTRPPKQGPARPHPQVPVSSVYPTAAEVRDAGVGAIDTTASGEIMYGKLCAPCHGATGQGYAADNAPSLVTTTFLESATDDFLHHSIAGGRPGSSMGAYGKVIGGPLDDLAIDRIVAFLRAKGPAAKALEAPGKGDATAGAKLYGEMCVSCHGNTGQRSTAVHLANAQFLTSATDAFLKYAITNGRPGTKMLAFGTVLKPQQIDDVTAYIRSFLVGVTTQAELLPEPTGKEPLVLNPGGKDPAFQPRENRFVPIDQIAVAYKAKRKMIIIDARPPSEWRRVHIKGAVSIPYHDTTRLADVPKDVYVLAYCACPHHLSGEVVDALVKLGHPHAYIIDEGINEWHRRLLPVDAAPGVQPPPKEPPVDTGVPVK